MHARFTDLRRKLRVNRKAIEEPVDLLAQLVWHQYANLVFSIHLDFKRLHDLLGRI